MKPSERLAAQSWEAPSDAELSAWPGRREAAAMLGISRLRLMFDGEVPFTIVAGVHRYSPLGLLRAGTLYRRRSLNEIAADLLAYAHERAGEAVVAVLREQIDDFFASRTPAPLDPEEFLRQARRGLPRRLYEQVERAYERGEAPGAEAPVASPKAPQGG